MKIRYTKRFPLKGFAAINLFGVVFARKECYPLSPKTVNHEAIHTAQMRELLYLIFYIWYGVEWVIRLIQYRDATAAYYNISFEREAYANERNEGYLKGRRMYAVKGYLKRV